MKNTLKLLGIIAFVMAIGFTMSSCASMSSTGAAVGPHGFFNGNSSASEVSSGAQEIGSYSVILGLFDSGYSDYAAAVLRAEKAGKTVTSVTKSYGMLVIVTKAYAK